MAFTQVTVTSTFVDGAGAAVRGWLRFTPSQSMANGADIVPAVPAVAYLSGGALSVSLAATDDPGTLPAGTTYLVEELLHGCRARSYRIALTYVDTSRDLGSIITGLPDPEEFDEFTAEFNATF